MQRTLPGTIGRALLALGLVLSFLTAPSITPQSHAANPSCSPVATIGNSLNRQYVFSGAGACDWTIPANWSSFSVEMVGGGGGGGGGSWAGSTGGGGGGGAPGARLLSTITATPGSTATITNGAGGIGGNGASTQGSTTGSNGSAGGLTSFVFSSSDSYTASGGGGGYGGVSDVGGAGGTGGGYKSLPYINIASVNGGSQNSGNGGEGIFAGGGGSSATTSSPGFSYFSYGYQSIKGLAGGGGGARTGTAPSGQITTSIGGSSSNAPQAGAANTGSGGGGGAGCSATSVTCANKNGTSGATGYIILYVQISISVTNQNRTSSNPALNTGSFAVGVAPTYPTLLFNGGFGNPTYSVSPALPAGISLNTSTGVLSGTPTAATPQSSYVFYATDSGGTVNSAGWSLVAAKGTGSTPTFTGTTLMYGVATALAASGGSGTGAISFSSSTSDCVVSGARGETVTAQKASGICTITATKAGDTNWYAASASAQFTLTKLASTIALAATPTSPREAGGIVTLTATTGSGQTGNVTFSAGGSAITSCGNSGVVAISGTTAICNWVTTSSGSPFALTASYAGDSNYQSSNSNSISYTIYPSIALAYPGISTTFGNAKNSTPTISGGTGSTSAWSWSVVKASDSSTVTGITINSSGVISASPSTATGTYAMRVTATDTVGISKSATVTVVVGLSSAANPTIASDKATTTAGATVVLTSTVNASATGTIAFKVGGNNISGCSAVAISSGIATCSWITSTASGSPFSLTAVYSGDSSYSTSTSATLTFTVAPAGTFTYATQSKAFGTNVTVTPSISGGIGNFSSWVIVKASDSSSVSGIYINSTGVVTLSSTVAAGSYSLVISANDQEGVTGSGTLQLTVTQATTSIVLTAQTITGQILTGGTLGRQIRLVATLNVPVGGSVVISDAVGTICTVFAFSTSGECWWAPSDASRSPYALTATFAGNANATAATSNTLSNFLWNAAMSVSHSNTSIETGKTVTITPTVSGGTGLVSTWNWGISQYFTGAAIGGIAINSSGVIRVSGSVAPGAYTMVVSSADLAGAYYYNNVTITIADVSAPNITLSFDNETVNVGSAFSPYTITNAGSDVDSFAIDQSLPAGLSFSASTGAIAGTPTETTTSLVLTLTASNFAGSDTATFTLTVNPLPGGGSSITISLAGGATTAGKGTAITITATVNVSGKVKFFANGKVIGGCAAKSATTSATCTWKPSVQGQSVLLTAVLNPTSGSYSTVKSAALNVGITRRTGLR